MSVASNPKLIGVHPDLIRVLVRFERLYGKPFRVLEGVRTLERQRRLVSEGASKTLNSRHLTGHAVDIAPVVNGGVSWHWPHYYPLAEVMKRAAAEERVAVQWGGDWRWKDGPHWELTWKAYPK